MNIGDVVLLEDGGFYQITDLNMAIDIIILESDRGPFEVQSLDIVKIYKEVK